MKNKKRLITTLAVLALSLGLLATLAVVGLADATPTLSINLNTLSLRDAICIKYAVEASGADDVKLLVWTSAQEQYTVGTQAKTLTAQPGTQTINGTPHLVFELPGISAKQMTEEYYARAYARVDGVDYYSDVQKYSVLKYAYDVQRSSTTTATLKELVTEMLEYGAAAQDYFSYNPTRPANATYREITLSGTRFSDGTTSGLFIVGDTVSVSAPETNANGLPFFRWENSKGVELSTSASAVITVGDYDTAYIPIYSNSLGIDGFRLVYSNDISDSMKLAAAKLYRAMTACGSGITVAEGGALPDSKYLHICEADEFERLYGYRIARGDYCIIPTDDGGAAIGAGGTTALEAAIELFGEKLAAGDYRSGVTATVYRYADTPSNTKFNEILSTFHNANGRLMSMGHRADLQNYPENSIPAIQSCIDAGVDILELDVRRTKDGKYVLMHDETVDRTTSGSGRVDSMTLAEIQALYLREGTGGTGAALTEHHPVSFEEALALCSNRIMIDLDKDPNNFTSTDIDYFSEIYALLEKHDCVKSTMYKSSADFTTYIKPKFDALDAAGKPRPLFSACIGTTTYAQMRTKIASYEGYTEMIEYYGFTQNPSDAAIKAVADYARGKGMRLMVLTINGSDDATVWASGASLGYGCFMTNHALDLAEYIKAVSTPKASTDILRAADFIESSGISLTGGSSYDPTLCGRVLDSISGGDYVKLARVSFSGSESAIRLSLDPRESFTLKIYSDSVSEANLIASIDFTEKSTRGREIYTVPLSATLSGTHSLILSFEGDSSYLATLDYLTFYEGADTVATVPSPYIDCLKGNVVLPSTVTCLSVLGRPIERAVVWDTPSSYAIGEHTVTGTTEDGLAVSATLRIRDCTVISSPSEWNAFAASVNSGISYKGEFVMLTSDLSFADTTFTVAGTAGAPFEGVFLGGGHTVSGISYSGSSYAGLFGLTNGADISGVTLRSCSFTTSYQYAGGIAAFAYGTRITECTTVSCSVISSYSGSSLGGVGGIVGYMESLGREAYAGDCLVVGGRVSGRRDVGGFTGDLKSGKIAHCTVNGTSVSSVQNATAGFAGDVHSGSVVDCHVSATVGYASGKLHIAAFTGYNAGTPTYENCSYDPSTNPELAVVCTCCIEAGRTYNGVFETRVLAPATLPSGMLYDVTARIGLDAATDYAGFGSSAGKCTNISWSTTGAAYRGALSFACSMTANNGGPNRAEGTLSLSSAVSPEGARGILFYVDFSRVDPDTSRSGPVASVTINGNTYRSNYGTKLGYYYEGGAWVETVATNACRMQLPEGYAGWVYVPFTSYSGAGTLYDAQSGIGLAGVEITTMNLYTDYYVYSDQKSITFDEIMLVK